MTRKRKWVIGLLLVFTFVIPVIPGLLLWLVSGFYNG